MVVQAKWHARLGRNDDCYCGSGRKYKQCHLRFDEAAEHAKAATRAEEARRAEEERIAAGYGETEHYHPISRKVPAVERADFRVLVARLSSLGVPMLVHAPQDLAREQGRLDEALAFASQRGVTVQFSFDVPQPAVDGLQRLVDGIYGRDVYLIRQSGTQLHGYGTTRLDVRDGHRVFLLGSPVVAAARLVLRESAVGEAVAQGIPGSPLSLAAVLGGVLRNLVVGCLELPEWARANLGMLLDAVIADITDTAELEDRQKSALDKNLTGGSRPAENVTVALAALPFALGLRETLDDPAVQLGAMGLSEAEATRLVPHLERDRDELPWIRAAVEGAGTPWESPEAFTRWCAQLGDVPELAALLEHQSARERDKAAVEAALAAATLTDNERLVTLRLLEGIPPPTTDDAVVERQLSLIERLRRQPTAVIPVDRPVEERSVAHEELAVGPTPALQPVTLPLSPVVNDPTLFADVDLVRAQFAELRDGVATRRLALQGSRQDAGVEIEARRQAARDAEMAVKDAERAAQDIDTRLSQLDDELTALGADERAQRARAVAQLMRRGCERLQQLEEGWAVRAEKASSPQLLKHRQTLSEYEVVAQQGLLESLPAGMRNRLEDDARQAREALGVEESAAPAVLPVAVVSAADSADEAITVVLPLPGGAELAPHSLAITVADVVCRGVAEGIDAMEGTAFRVTHETAGGASLLRFQLTGHPSGSDALDYVQIGIDETADSTELLRQARVNVRCLVAADLDDTEVSRALLLDEHVEAME